jgi:hypothetical protein
VAARTLRAFDTGGRTSETPSSKQMIQGRIRML